MFKAHVFEVLITSPNDVPQELIDDIRQGIYTWNRIHSRRENIMLKPLRWETDVYSSLTMSEPQTIINTQIVKKADILIGVFWTRIGTPTENYISGSVEEIEEHLDARKPAMLFFLQKDIDQNYLANRKNKSQYKKLLQFKDKWKGKGIYKDFRENEKTVIFNHLSMLLSNRNNDDYFIRILESHRYDWDFSDFKKQMFEYQFTEKKDGKRIWIQQSPYLWIEKTPYSAIPDKPFLCYDVSDSINGVKGMIVQCANKDEEIGFQVFIPEPNDKDMHLYYRIVNKQHNDWELLGVGPITYLHES